ncbi:MAG: ankyrin repeat domain-containing protein [Steroidobacteraceae bacterium]
MAGMRALAVLAVMLGGNALRAAETAAVDSDGTTPLHLAVYRNDVAEVKRLIAARADVNARNDYGSTPLTEAAVTGNVEVITQLLKAGAAADSANADGQTALMILARTSNVAAAQLLLKRGAKVNAREQWREQTPLMWAAAEGQPAMVQLLVKHGAQVDARSRVNEWERQVTAEPRQQQRPSGGFTPLLYAARRGCVECARILLKAGANVNLTDPDRVSPLLLATMNLNFDTAALLIQHGADVNKWDTWGRSPIYAAVDVNTLPTGGRADRPSADQTSGIQLIEMLLKAGANPNLQLKLNPPWRSLRDDRGADTVLTVGATPLLRAAKAGDVPAVRLLLAAGARVDLPTVNGVTPLLAAAGVGSTALDTRGRYKTEAQALETTQLLLAAGADVKASDRSGATGLHGAANWGFNSVIGTLAERGADLFAKDARGRTAVDLTRGEASTSGRAAGSQPRPETEALLRKLMAAQRPATATAGK